MSILLRLDRKSKNSTKINDMKNEKNNKERQTPKFTQSARKHKKQIINNIKN